MAITTVWLLLLALLILLLWHVFRKQWHIDSLFNYFTDIDVQYETLCKFRDNVCPYDYHTNDRSYKSFSQRDFSEYLEQEITRIKGNTSGAKKGMIGGMRFDLNDIIPRLSEVIILRAAEKGIVEKINKPSWYDEYFFTDEFVTRIHP